MQHYEMLYIVHPDFTDEEHAKLTASAENLIKNEGGIISASEMLGKKKLAYPIKKAVAGYYNLLSFDIEPGKLPLIEQKFRLMTEILRFLLVIKKPVKEKPREIRPRPAVIEAPAPRIFKKEPTKEKTKEKLQKVSIEELDKKLDEILGDDVVK